MRPTSDPRDRVLARARPEGGCWLLDGASNGRGYRIVKAHGQKVYAHRLVLGREIPEGFEVHHRCGQPSCVKPEHLAVVPITAHRSAHSRAMWAKRRRRQA